MLEQSEGSKLGHNCRNYGPVGTMAWLARVAATLLLAMSLPATLLRAQCSPQWLPGSGISGVSLNPSTVVTAIVEWDPDGPGPRLPVQVVSASDGSINAYDPATGSWTLLGAADRSVNALTVRPNGELIAGGAFSRISGTPARGIARFDPSGGTAGTGAWVELGSGMTNPLFQTPAEVNVLLNLPNGNLAVGGWFSGGQFTNVFTSSPNVIAWTGSGWSALVNRPDLPPEDFVRPRVFAMLLLPNGNLVVGGVAQFSSVNPSMIVWIGERWARFAGTLSFGQTVLSLTALPNGNIAVGGRFGGSFGTPPVAGGNGIVVWNGSAWQSLGSGINGEVAAARVLRDGRLMVVGDFSPPTGIGFDGAIWNGSAWAPLGAGFGLSARVATITEFADGTYAFGGTFTNVSDLAVAGLVRWDGEVFSPFGRQFNGRVLAVTSLSNGDLVVGGSFSAVGGVQTGPVARWNGARWFAMGLGFDGPVFALARLPNGDIIAGGAFRNVGSLSVNGVARWTGQSWSAVGGGVGDTFLPGSVPDVRAIIPLGTLGEFAIGGNFIRAGSSPTQLYNVARWSLSGWSGYGGGVFGRVHALAIGSNGRLVAGGDFAGGIAEWDGFSWRPLGSGLSGGVFANVRAIVRDGTSLVVGGGFTSAGGSSAAGVARWNGSSWSAMSTGLPGTSGRQGTVNALVVTSPFPAASYPGGIVAAGQFLTTGSNPASNIARWSGTEWIPLPNTAPQALGIGGDTDAEVHALHVSPRNELISGGRFTSAGRFGATNLARYTLLPVPWVAEQPAASSTFNGQTLRVQAVASPGYPAMGVRWFRNNLPIINGPQGASIGGGTVSGAVGLVPDNGVAVLTIEAARVSDSGQYTASFFNDCASAVTTSGVRIVVRVFPSCPTDYNLDGVVNVDDISDFVTDYFTVPPVAGPGGYAVPCPGAPAPYNTAGYKVDFNGDCNVNTDDISDFITAYFNPGAGC